MELFASTDSVTSLDQALAALPDPARRDPARLDLLLPLAWQLRERNCRRAGELLDEAERLLSTLPDAKANRILARLLLTRGVLFTLHSELDTAANHINEALSRFQVDDDLAGLGDSKFCLASVCQDRGQATLRNQLLDDAILDYQAAGDRVREQLCRARSLHYRAFRDASGTRTALSQHFPNGNDYPPAVCAWLNSARGVVAILTGDPGTAIREFFNAFQGARETGQIRQAIVAASNAADAYATLGDLDAALELDEQALDLARANALPGMMGSALIQTGNVLRLLGRYQEARTTLLAAQTALSAMSDSATWRIALQYLGELELAMDNPDTALGFFDQIDAKIKVRDEPQAVLRCWRGQGSALCRLKQPDAALAKINDALNLARHEKNADEEVKILRILAELYHEFALPAPENLIADSAELHFLNQALDLAASISGYILPPDLLDTVANAHAACGNFQQAFISAQRAASARDSKRLSDASNRAIAMQVRHDTERAHAEAEHHRQLANTESRRAAVLQEASSTLETLGLIGREITASLNAEAVFAALTRHVNHLLDASSFFVYLLAPEGQILNGVFGVEMGQMISLDPIDIDDPNSFTARCAREKQEIFIDTGPEVYDAEIVPGTLDTISLLFTPLQIGERLLGVMSIQSTLAHAYGERERSIFRTLCAYGAIALDNAAAYSVAEGARHQADQALAQLQLTQNRLVQSEKMASLGRLVAGIAHELNTPLGNGLVAVSTLRDQLNLFRQTTLEHGLKRHAFDTFLANVDQASGIALKSLNRGARLVNSFKQLAVGQTGAKRQEFMLSDVITRVVAEFEPRLKDTPFHLQVSPPPEVKLNSFPESLLDVINRLVENAIVHGFEERDQGMILIRCKLGGTTGLRILVQDNGRGIAEKDQAKVFDPFFTTHLGQGSSGLGLHIAHNTVTQILGGTLAVFSQPEEGSEFEIDLPLSAPQQDRSE